MVSSSSLHASEALSPTDTAAAPSAQIERPGRLKRLINRLALVMVAPAAVTCVIERKLKPGSETWFCFWAHVFALLPGVPGMFLRRAFYRCTLEQCAENVTIQFGAVCTHRNSVLETGVYIGSYALIGSAVIQEYSLIGSRASLLSGGRHHELLPSGRWSPTDSTKLTRITIGPNTWIGEGAILMAGTGRSCMVAAGSVVSTAVPPSTMVAGNPARLVRRLTVESSDAVEVKGRTDVAGAASIR
jgi:virginiamycin A acetyltransferase